MGYGKRKLPPDLFNKPKQPEKTDSGYFLGIELGLLRDESGLTRAPGGSERSAVPGKGGGAAEVSGGHHEPILSRGCFPGPVRPYGVAYIVGV
jgi:hypothetical protein